MPDIGFFAFNSKNGECACYFAALGCPDDDLFNDYNAYSIIEGSFNSYSRIFYTGKSNHLVTYYANLEPMLNITDAAELASQNVENLIEDAKNALNNIDKNLGSFVKTKRSANDQIGKYLSNLRIFIGVINFHYISNHSFCDIHNRLR